MLPIKNITTDDFFRIEIVNNQYIAPNDRYLLIERIYFINNRSGNSKTFRIETEIVSNLKIFIDEVDVPHLGNKDFIPKAPLLIKSGQSIFIPADQNYKSFIEGVYVWKEQRISKQVFEQSLQDVKEAIKLASTEALREASMKILVEEVATDIASGGSSSLSEKLGDLIEVKVSDAIRDFESPYKED